MGLAVGVGRGVVHGPVTRCQCVVEPELGVSLPLGGGLGGGGWSWGFLFSKAG